MKLILYSKAQIDKEANEEIKKKRPIMSKITPSSYFNAEWGIVSILGLNSTDDEPMSPMTMLRNALGIEYGGSGAPLNDEEYVKSVKYWSEHAIIK